MLLFSLDTSQNAVINIDAAKICPELKKITKEELLYIIVVYDYHSPHSQFDLEERRGIALNKYLKGKKNPETKIAVQKAIEAYKSLQFDQKRETLSIYREKINSLTTDLIDAEDSARISDIIKSSESIRKQIDSIEKKIDDDEKMAEIKGGSTLSFIEQVQNNRKEYLDTWKPQESARNKKKIEEMKIDE